MSQKILVIDDEKSIRDLVSRILEGSDYKVISASDGKEGFGRIYSDSPDLVILDVNMPEMNGWELVKKIRQDPLYKNLPVIMLTVNRTEEDQIKGLNLGCDEYITKPFYPKELILRVKKILQKK